MTDDTHDETATESNGATNETADGEQDADAPSGPVEPQPITPAAPEAFGRVQVWWGGGKGKTTAAMGMGMRAAGHGYRVHLLQFMKGGAASVEDVRGEYNAIAALSGFSYENSGHYGWHGSLDGTDEDAHEARAAAGLERTRELLDAAADGDPTTQVALDAPPEAGVHLLILDEILYAANRGLIDPDDVVELIERAPEQLELVLTGGHEEPTYATSEADLVTHVEKRRHHFDEGGRARKGTEF
ncbi:cob(I)yrinic acid a,c-diamide adenosyltransferase [Halobaculum sp. MBLA0143]|uniref:cob(I)yrinic acid a,c-diamide adenosyltransferase n=1 Tax=Halobaculum sp. MBLA0143 TaxID=3079933 RepID=UPI003524CB08